MRYLLIFLLFIAIYPAHAAPPACDAAREGVIIYNKDHKIVQFCNGTQWIGMVARIGDNGDTLGGLSCANGQIAKWNGASWACAEDEAGLNALPALNSANIWVGNASNEATALALSGDAALSSAGVLTIADNAVTSAKIADGAVGLTDLAANSVDSSKIVDSSVATVDIANSAITNDKIANAAIVATDKLSATGTKNNTTFLRGDNTWAAPAGGSGGSTYQTFTTVGTATWSKPSTGTVAFIECWGGGGSGGGALNATGTGNGASGGGGGGYNARLMPLTALSASVTVTVGAGGAALTTNANGNPGGLSSFGSYLRAYGGGGGGGYVSGSSPFSSGGGGGGQISAGGLLDPGQPQIGGPDGNSMVGQGAIADTVPSGGHYHGGGGGTGAASATTNRNGRPSVYGGAGGAGRNANGNGVGGTSMAGGKGGDAPGGAGAQPGGGGAANVKASGKGGDGRCNVTVW